MNEIEKEIEKEILPLLNKIGFINNYSNNFIYNGYFFMYHEFSNYKYSLNISKINILLNYKIVNSITYEHKIKTFKECIIEEFKSELRKNKINKLINEQL